jgi:RNA polymerase sigma-54 factor
MQIGDFNYTDQQEQMSLKIIENIDEDGYFSPDLALFCAEEHCSLENGEALLKDIQTLSPRGVGARDLCECILLQLDDASPHFEILTKILRKSLQDIAQNRATKLFKEYGITREELVKLQEYIKSLDPRPGARFFQQQKIAYAIPDLAVKKNQQSFSVEVAGDSSTILRFDKEYLELRSKVDSASDASRWMEVKYSEANLILRNLDRRKQTLYRFGAYLVEAQYEFFLFGEERLKALTMQEAADALGVHVSTISRTVQDKYMLTPWGVYPLRFFFCSALDCMRSDEASTISSRTIKSRIKELISEEDKGKPLSDRSITDLLNEEGIEISRRTVTKYREALGIENQSQRRR